jgi:DNA polymerase-3 subunit epsilon
MRVLFFDTETTGLPLWKEPSSHPDQPHIVDLACELWEISGETPELIETLDCLINPGVPISAEVSAIHGITDEMVQADGIEPKDALKRFFALLDRAERVAGHNVDFDIRLIRIAGYRHFAKEWTNPLPTFCTMRRTTNICKILKENPRTRNDYKWPKLSEATRFFFNEELPDAHRAMPDVQASRRIFFHLMEKGLAS